jgi:hypothetical protein
MWRSMRGIGPWLVGFHASTATLMPGAVEPNQPGACLHGQP